MVGAEPVLIGGAVLSAYEAILRPGTVWPMIGNDAQVEATAQASDVVSCYRTTTVVAGMQSEEGIKGVLVCRYFLY